MNLKIDVIDLTADATNRNARLADAKSLKNLASNIKKTKEVITMFTIKKNSVYRVHSARNGNQKDGKPYAMLKFLECENQPEDLENPSKAKTPLYCWYETFPETLKGVKDGALVRIVDFEGVDLYRDSYERFGKTEFSPCLRLINATIELA